MFLRVFTRQPGSFHGRNRRHATKYANAPNARLAVLLSDCQAEYILFSQRLALTFLEDEPRRQERDRLHETGRSTTELITKLGGVDSIAWLGRVRDLFRLMAF